MNTVSRSMEATAARAAARVERGRKAQPSGWWGVALLIATEAALFGCMIATYFYLRFDAATWPPDGIEKPSVTLPLVFTAMLVISALPMLGALRAARAGRRGIAWGLLALATAVQATYLGLQIHLFVDDLAKFSPRDDAYGSIYFTLLGVHHFHVAVGLALSAWLLARLLGGMTNYRLLALRVITLYWMFVIAVAIPVVFTVLYPSL
jgi:heme/copper-type cytochrome/quinol oxidase subunit 3